jgi:tRNA dimethylallyltransferase
MIKSSLPKVVVIVGPTATNKTKLAINLARKFNGEIINADAFQVYKEIGIGTAKTSVDELKGVKIHLNNEISMFDD